MFCANCGTKLAEAIKFCHNCGFRIESTILVPEVSKVDYSNGTGGAMQNSGGLVSNLKNESIKSGNRERHGFVTFWLVLMLVFNIFLLLHSFSDNARSFYDMLRGFNLITTQTIIFFNLSPIVYIISVILLLNYKKIGFWMIVGLDVIGPFIISNTGAGIVIWLCFGATKIAVLFGILNIRKDGISTWEQLELVEDGGSTNETIDSKTSDMPSIGQMGDAYTVISETVLRKKPGLTGFGKKRLYVGEMVYFLYIKGNYREWFYVKTSDQDEGWCPAESLRKGH